ncbi:FAD-binding oxidoreductase [bacterium]|nr:FAD-binding oxidoreductase [bacterium]
MTSWHQETIAGWGRSRVSVTHAGDPRRVEELPDYVAERKHLVARGLGRSYGDASLNTGQAVVRMESVDRAVEFDREQGRIVCEAGMSLDDLITITLPSGWFPAVTPGTRYVSVGGCIASDVHGKNHHVAGTFSQHVNWVELLTADGSIVRCSAEDNADLFHATAGGMGLTGIIVRACLQLQKVDSSYLMVRRERTLTLQDTMRALVEGDREWDATVAWLDGVAPETRMGRGEVILGRHIGRDELPERLAYNPFRSLDEPLVDLPVDMPFSMVHRSVVRAFNQFRFSRIQEGDSFENVRQFYYPLDVAQGWNRLYGPHGFHQYQFVIGDDDAESLIGDLLYRFHRSGLVASLVVLKRFGAESGWLSFPKPGWTLAVDTPSNMRLFELLEEFDERIVADGGRIYLAKDSRLAPDRFRRMYPEYANKWLDVKRKYDPECRFSSDLSRRLRIDDDVLGDGA